MASIPVLVPFPPPGTCARTRQFVSCRRGRANLGIMRADEGNDDDPYDLGAELLRESKQGHNPTPTQEQKALFNVEPWVEKNGTTPGVSDQPPMSFAELIAKELAKNRKERESQELKPISAQSKNCGAIAKLLILERHWRTALHKSAQKNDPIIGVSEDFVKKLMANTQRLERNLHAGHNLQFVDGLVEESYGLEERWQDGGLGEAVEGWRILSRGKKKPIRIMPPPFASNNVSEIEMASWSGLDTRPGMGEDSDVSKKDRRDTQSRKRGREKAGNSKYGVGKRRCGRPKRYDGYSSGDGEEELKKRPASSAYMESDEDSVGVERDEQESMDNSDEEYTINGEMRKSKKRLSKRSSTGSEQQRKKRSVPTEQLANSQEKSRVQEKSQAQTPVKSTEMAVVSESTSDEALERVTEIVDRWLNFCLLDPRGTEPRYETVIKALVLEIEDFKKVLATPMPKKAAASRCQRKEAKIDKYEKELEQMLNEEEGNNSPITNDSSTRSSEVASGDLPKEADVRENGVEMEKKKVAEEKNNVLEGSDERMEEFVIEKDGEELRENGNAINGRNGGDEKNGKERGAEKKSQDLDLSVMILDSDSSIDDSSVEILEVKTGVGKESEIASGSMPEENRARAEGSEGLIGGQLVWEGVRPNVAEGNVASDTATDQVVAGPGTALNDASSNYGPVLPVLGLAVSEDGGVNIVYR